jgi:zinc/manganese transport system ATP-binding protein
MTLPAGDALNVRGLSVALAGRAVLDSVNFSLPAGGFCGLIGANGSGKTTLLRAILGLVKPAAGRIELARPIGYVPQKIQLDPDMPLRARDLVALGLDGNRLGLPLPSRRRAGLVEEALRAVDALGFADQRLGNLSGGQQQRVLIAHALVGRPRLLLLDEPLASLDIRAIAGIVGVLKNLSRALGITVLVSAHDMNPLLGAMDQIVYLAHGRAASGPTAAVVRTEVLSALYGYHIDVIRVHGRVLVVAAGAAGEPAAAVPHGAAVP